MSRRRNKKSGKWICGVRVSEAPGDTREGKLRYVVASGTAHLVEGDLVDLFTASAVVQVLDRLNEVNRAKLLGLGLRHIVSVVWRLLDEAA